MATNRIYRDGNTIPAVPTVPDNPTSGDPVAIGSLPGVALTNADDDGEVTVQTNGVFSLPTTGEVAVGDPLRIDADGALSVADEGVHFGVALEAGNGDSIRVAVGAGSTTEQPAEQPAE